MSAPDAVFEIRDVVRRFAGSQCEGVGIGSLTFRRGRVTAVMGQSGCGKSTLLNLMAGLECLDARDEGSIVYRPSSGAEILWRAGQARAPACLRWETGLIFQADELLDQLDVGSNAGLPRTLHGHTLAPETLGHALEAVELPETWRRVNPGDLSGGERARIAFLRGLLHDPQVVLCDEPTSDLDPKRADGLMARLTAWRDQQPERRSVICVTHDVDAAFRWADEIWVWAPGEPGRFRSFRRTAATGWSADQWRQVRSTLECAWAATEPPPRGRPAALRMPTIPPLAPTAPRLSALIHLGLRDFWRHPRSQGGALQRLLPGLLWMVSVLLYLSLFLGRSVEQGISRRLETERSAPSFRLTELRLRRRTEQTAAFLALFPLRHAQFVRVFADIRVKPHGEDEPGDPLQSVVHFRGLALHPQSELFGAIRRSLYSTHAGHLAELDRVGDRAEGIILGHDVCEAIYGAEPPTGWVSVLFAQVVEAPDGRTRTIHYDVPLPLLGCAPSLPSGHRFVVTLGFARARGVGQRSILRPSRFYLTGLGKAGLLPRDRAAADLPTVLARRRQVEQQLTERLVRYAAQESIGFDGNLRVTTSGPISRDAGPWLRVELGDGQGHPVPLSKGWIEQAVDDLGLHLGTAFDEAHRYPAAGPRSKARADRWIFPLPPDMEAHDYARYVADAEEAGVFANTAVVARLHALDRMESTLRGFHAVSQRGLFWIVTLVLVALLFFESLRKVRGYGVLRAAGLRPGGYLVMAITQSVIVQTLAVGVAAALEGVALPGLICWIFETQVGLSIDYPSFSAPWSTPGLALAIVVLVPAVVRSWLLFRLAPANLMRFRVM